MFFHNGSVAYIKLSSKVVEGIIANLKFDSVYISDKLLNGMIIFLVDKYDINIASQCQYIKAELIKMLLKIEIFKTSIIGVQSCKNATNYLKYAILLDILKGSRVDPKSNRALNVLA
jgi:hypothetical protein